MLFSDVSLLALLILAFDLAEVISHFICFMEPNSSVIRPFISVVLYVLNLLLSMLLRTCRFVMIVFNLCLFFRVQGSIPRSSVSIALFLTDIYLSCRSMMSPSIWMHLRFFKWVILLRRCSGNVSGAYVSMVVSCIS